MMNYANIDWQAIFYKPVCQLDENNCFVYETTAELDCYAKDGSYLIPAGCIEVEPPEVRENQVAQWQPETQTWQYLPDYRGQTVYDIATGAAIVVNELGELPETVTTEICPSERHTWNGNTWIISTDAVTQMFQAAKSAKLNALNQAAQNYINQVAGIDKLPQFEVDTWTIQALEAKAWVVDPNAPTPTLDTIATARSIPPNILKQKALEKAQKFEQLTATVVGMRQAIETRINRATDIDELDAIEFAFGEHPSGEL